MNTIELVDLFQEYSRRLSILEQEIRKREENTKQALLEGDALRLILEDHDIPRPSYHDLKARMRQAGYGGLR